MSACAPDATPVQSGPTPRSLPESLPKPNEVRTSARPADGTPLLKQAQYEVVEAPEKARPNLINLQVPAALPGGKAIPIDNLLPPPERGREKEREAAIDRLYPPLPPLGADPTEHPGPEGHPLTLSDLQKLASANSPLLRQAAADVAATRGAAIQAGLPPNPIFGFEQDTAGTAGGPGYLGGFLDQKIITAGKLKIAVAAAGMDYFNAQVALRRARIDLAGQVRAGYFAVLVARENMRVARILTEFTDELFRIQIVQLKAGVAAAYEPMQLRVLVMQARGNLVQARNRYTSAWKQLAAAMGLPGMTPTEIEGRPDIAIPAFKFDATLARILENHTDVLTASNGIRKARYNLRLAQVTPIPDPDVRLMLQKDFTGPPFEMSPSIQIGVPVPVWDRNQGNIMQAQAQLVRAVEESHRVRNDLTTRLADAFERFENNRVMLAYYRDHILPDQVRAYRGVYERHQQEPAMVGFGDVVTAQQTLASAVTTYIATLGSQWTAVIDVATLLQTDDLFSAGELSSEPLCVASVPDLSQLLPLPCGHVCSPLKDPMLKAGDPNWPAAEPAEKKLLKPEEALKEESKPAPQQKPAPTEEPKPTPQPGEQAPLPSGAATQMKVEPGDRMPAPAPMARTSVTQLPAPPAPAPHPDEGPELKPASQEEAEPTLEPPPVTRAVQHVPADNSAPPQVNTRRSGQRIPPLPDE